MNLRNLRIRPFAFCTIEGEAAPADGAGGGSPPATIGEVLYPEGGEKLAEAAPLEPAKTEEAPAAEAKPEVEGETKPESETPAALEIKVPDGFEVDEAAMGSFKELAAKAGLKGEDAQALFDLYAADAQKSADANEKAWVETQTAWKKEIDSDSELGGDKQPGVIQAIGRALDEFGSKEAREAFELTGAGNNPAIVRFVYKMAAALSEGTITPGGRPAPKGPQTLGQIFYPDKT